MGVCEDTGEETDDVKNNAQIKICRIFRLKAVADIAQNGASI